MISWLASMFEVTGAGVMAIAIMTILFKLRTAQKKQSNQPSQLPPGPKGVPLLGTFPLLFKAPAHIVFQDWTKKFGKVFRFTLGRGAAIVLGDASTVREVFVHSSPDADSRSQWRSCFIQTFRGLSTLPYSLKWKNTRRRTLTILRNLGMGKSKMEQKISQENADLVASLIEAGEYGKRNFDPENILRRSSMKVLYKIMFGERFDFDHSDVEFMMSTILYVFDFLAKASIYDILPGQVRKLVGFSLKNFNKRLDRLSQVIRNNVNEHKSTYNQREADNFVDSWLKASEEETEKQDKSICGDLPDVLQDIAIAGGHTTGIIYRWAILLLTIHKPIQDKAYREIVERIGPESQPSMTDRPKLRYIEAIINEVLRIASVLPLVAHATWKDTKVGGYDVPAGTEVIYNAWSLNRNEEVFPEPNIFNPDRWLRDGEIRKELFHDFFPFGIDESVDGNFKPEMKHQFGLLADCKPYMVRTKLRLGVS